MYLWALRELHYTAFKMPGSVVLMYLCTLREQCYTASRMPRKEKKDETLLESYSVRMYLWALRELHYTTSDVTGSVVLMYMYTGLLSITRKQVVLRMRK